MRPRLIMGNWKMHGNHASIHALLQHLVSLQQPPETTVVVFPPFVYLEKTHWELRHSIVQLGAQDVSRYCEGAYTGEVSAAMLKDSGCRYVLVGHSERRHLLAEGEEIIAEKFLRVIEQGLKPVLCVGETTQQRDHHHTEQTLLAQLQNVLNLPLSVDQLATMVIAYEPVWAIGTGVTATPHQAQQVHQLLRGALLDYDVALATVPLLYGGSVNGHNARALLAMPDIDGALIGGASLDGEAFREICHGGR